MDDNEKKRFARIDIGDLFDVANPHAIKNFYLSHLGLGGRIFVPGSSFSFNGFYIGICRGGECSMRISGRDYSIEKDSLQILSPDQLVEISSVSESYSCDSIIVSLDVILEFPSPVDIDVMTSALRNPVLHIGETSAMHLLEYYTFIEKRYSETSSAYREEISKTLLYALMLEICNILRNISDEDTDVAKPKQEKLTDDFFKLMAKHYRTEHNVAFYASKLHRTPKYLSGAIRRISGRSVAEWINSTLVSEIKMQLKTTDKTVLEISEELNFSSPSVMVQFFRHHTGITPLQYRKA